MNLSRAADFIREAASKGAQLIVLPECFNSPYGTSYFSEYCEPIPGESMEFLRQVAKDICYRRYDVHSMTCIIIIVMHNRFSSLMKTPPIILK